MRKHYEEIEVNINKRTTANCDILAVALATVTTVAGSILKLNGKRISDWKYNNYLEWSQCNHIQDDIENLGLDPERLALSKEIINSLLRKYFRGTTKASANKQLDTISVFMDELKNSLTHNDTKTIIYGYYAKYCTCPTEILSQYKTSTI